jgi:hypothetical protein
MSACQLGNRIIAKFYYIFARTTKPIEWLNLKRNIEGLGYWLSIYRLLIAGESNIFSA